MKFSEPNIVVGFTMSELKMTRIRFHMYAFQYVDLGVGINSCLLYAQQRKGITPELHSCSVTLRRLINPPKIVATS